MKQNRPPRVTVMLSIGIHTHRLFLNGILRYQKLHGPWAMSISRNQLGSGEGLLMDTDVANCDGVIGGFNLPVYAGLLKTVAVPVVFTSLDVIGQVPSRIPWVCHLNCDNAEIGVKAAEYYLERGFTAFAYVGDPGRSFWSEERRIAYTARLSKVGRWCAVCPNPSPANRRDFNCERERLAKWLKSLPEGCAVFAANDNRARQLFDAAREAGLMVGRDLAVLGVDNDETVCETTNPPLSSIQMTAEQTGFLAARLLDKVMRRKNPDVFPQSPQMLLYGFSSIKERDSTLATPPTSDNVVTRALDVINRKAGKGLKVSGLARDLKISMRILEMKFKKETGFSVCKEIHRVRLEEVKRLARETELTCAEIAERCGFYNPSHLSTAFRRSTDQTLSAFRASYRRALMLG